MQVYLLAVVSRFRMYCTGHVPDEADRGRVDELKYVDTLAIVVRFIMYASRKRCHHPEASQGSDKIATPLGFELDKMSVLEFPTDSFSNHT